MTERRRAVLKTLAVAPLAPAALIPQAPPTSPPPASPATASGPEAVAEALAEAVKRQFGAHLDVSDLEAVKKELAGNLERSARLRRAARLGNADEPVNRFEARPPEAGPRGGRS